MNKNNETDLDAIRRAGEAKMNASEIKHSEELWQASLNIIGGATPEAK